MEGEGDVDVDDEVNTRCGCACGSDELGLDVMGVDDEEDPEEEGVAVVSTMRDPGGPAPAP